MKICPGSIGHRAAWHDPAFVYNLTNWLIKEMAGLLHRRHALRSRMGSRGQPEESRAAILRAAAQEFAEHGIAGARTDAIAREARVNKALLYYYFKDFVPSMVAMIVFYFSSAPMMQKIVGFNPLTPERIAERRAAVLDFISAALFRPKNATQGARS